MGDVTRIGLPVLGYRPQGEAAIDTVNRNKAAEEYVLRMIDDMIADEKIDARWLAVGRTLIEQGFMAVNRAVFKPERVKLPADVKA